MINVPEIRAQMGRRNVTMKELAAVVDKSPATLSRWFEECDMPVECAEKIANYLGFAAHDLLPIFFTSFVA